MGFRFSGYIAFGGGIAGLVMYAQGPIALAFLALFFLIFGSAVLAVVQECDHEDIVEEIRKCQK